MRRSKRLLSSQHPRKFRPIVEFMEERHLLSGLTLLSATALPDGRTVQLSFVEPLPSSQGIPDWMPGYQNGVRLTLSNGVTLEQIGNVAQADSVNLTWTATYLIDDPTQVIQFGQTGLTLSADTNLLQDNVGNFTSSFTNYNLVNNSLVDASGFTTQSFNRANGGVTIFVSSTFGNDNITFIQSQNPATPYRTLSNALAKVFANGMNGKGADIRLLRGDTFDAGGGIKTSGQDAAHPFIIEDYWYSYFTGTVDPGTRPVIAIDEANTVASDVLDTTSGGQTPATVDNVVIRRIDFEAVDWTGNINSRYGLDFLRGGENWTIDDCVVKNFGTGIVIQGFWGPFSDVTLLRDNILDSRYDNSVIYAHSQGLFLSNVTNILISQCNIDNNGRVSADRTGRDMYSHNVYIKEDCGPAVVWGNVFREGGSYGIEMRSGGVLAYNYFGRNALAAYIDGPGGTQYKNVVENAEDISSLLPRGFGLEMNSTYGSSLAQEIEFNVIVNAVGHQDEAILIDQVNPNSVQNALISHNTVVNAGQVKYNSSSNTPASLSVTNTNNILDSGSAFLYSVPSFTGWAFYQAGNNALNSTASRNRVTQIGNDPLTLASWQTATGGAETTSVSLSPQYVNNSADLGGFFQSVGGTDSEADYGTLERNRPSGVWNSAFSTLSIYQYFATAYQPTNLPAIGSGMFDYYGASDYRTMTSADS